MTMVSLEPVLVVYILLELRTAFVDPQTVGAFLFDYGRWSLVGNESFLICNLLVLKFLPLFLPLVDFLLS
jgi:hypothetical protein